MAAEDRGTMAKVAQTARTLPGALARASEASHRVTLRRIPDGPLADPLAARVSAFDRHMRMPLGEGGTFRRVHARDYGRFYRSLGAGSASWYAEMDDRIVGTMSIAILRIGRGWLAQRAAYVCNLRVAPEARFGAVLHRFHMAALAWSFVRGWAAISITQDGPHVAPDRRTGKLGIPHFSRLGAVDLVSLPVDTGAPADAAAIADERRVRRLHRRLTGGIATPIGGRPADRSERPPVWLALPDGSACGCVEDNGLAKRVLADDGEEIPWRCLSFFAAATDNAAVRLAREAARVAGSLGPGPLHATIDPRRATRIVGEIGAGRAEVIPMAIHGFGVPPLPRGPWGFHASEI
jgi:hypothetical protein